MQMHYLSRSRMAKRCVVACASDAARKWKRPSGQHLMLLLSTVVLTMVFYRVFGAEARYLLPANYGAGSYRDFHKGEGSMPALRRQDFDDSNSSSDADEDLDDADDQNAAASYQNQNDGANQEGGRSTDGFDDNEPDGPYEETPVEQEGQADLERFFDDHLGASDRDGMDKENLPTNLIASLSEAPQLNTFGPQVLQAAPSASVENPLIEPPSKGALAALATIQTTSLIRLPAERKLIVTNQITRNTVGGPLKYADGVDDKGRQRAFYARHEAGQEATPTSSSAAFSSAAQRNDPTGVALNIELDPSAGESQQQLSSSPSESHNQARRKDGGDERLASHGSEVVITENDDDDRVYVTNSTNGPFRIDALGGFDPEADFQDAAQELDVAPERRPRTSARSVTSSTKDDEEDSQGSENFSTNQERQETAPNRHEFASHESPESDMYEEASETDEVTFGQDDPYQTDLEAEMRHQQYDRVGNFMARSPSGRGRSKGARNAREDDEKPEEAGESRESADFNNDDGKVDPNDRDVDIDNEYTPLKAEARQDTRRLKLRPLKADEGGWVNDGADEMDIPSQSHQNYILDKAAKHDAMVRKAAEDEMEAAKMQPEKAADESGQTSSDDEENQRMPNADYLRDDFKIEDDSGYAA